MPNITYNTKRFFITRWTNSLYFLLTGCKFQVPQNLRRLINVYAINFMP
jgi:hypothetical protein